MATIDLSKLVTAEMKAQQTRQAQVAAISRA